MTEQHKDRKDEEHGEVQCRSFLAALAQADDRLNHFAELLVPIRFGNQRVGQILEELSPEVIDAFLMDHHASEADLQKLRALYPTLLELENIFAQTDAGQNLSGYRSAQKELARSREQVRSIDRTVLSVYVERSIHSIDFAALITQGELASTAYIALPHLLTLHSFANTAVEEVIEEDNLFDALIWLQKRQSAPVEQSETAPADQNLSPDESQTDMEVILSLPDYISDFEQRVNYDSGMMPSLKNFSTQPSYYQTLSALNPETPESPFRRVLEMNAEFAHAVAEELLRVRAQYDVAPKRLNFAQALAATNMRQILAKASTLSDGFHTTTSDAEFDSILDRFYEESGHFPVDMRKTTESMRLAQHAELLNAYIAEQGPLHPIDKRILRSQMMYLYYLISTGKLDNLYRQRVASGQAPLDADELTAKADLLATLLAKNLKKTQEQTLGYQPYLATAGVEGETSGELQSLQTRAYEAAEYLNKVREIELKFQNSDDQKRLVLQLAMLIKRGTIELGVSETLLRYVTWLAQLDFSSQEPDRLKLLFDSLLENFYSFLTEKVQLWTRIATNSGEMQYAQVERLLTQADRSPLVTAAAVGAFANDSPQLSMTEVITAPSVDPRLLSRDFFHLMLATAGQILPTNCHLTGAGVELSEAHGEASDILAVFYACGWICKGNRLLLSQKNIPISVIRHFLLKPDPLSSENFIKIRRTSDGRNIYLAHHSIRDPEKLWQYNNQVQDQIGFELRSFMEETDANEPINWVRCVTLFTFMIQAIKAHQLRSENQRSPILDQLSAAYQQFIFSWHQLLAKHEIDYPEFNRRFMELDRKGDMVSIVPNGNEGVYNQYLVNVQAQSIADDSFMKASRKIVHAFNHSVRSILTEHHNFLIGQKNLQSQ